MGRGHTHLEEAIALVAHLCMRKASVQGERGPHVGSRGEALIWGDASRCLRELTGDLGRRGEICGDA